LIAALVKKERSNTCPVKVISSLGQLHLMPIGFKLKSNKNITPWRKTKMNILLVKFCPSNDRSSRKERSKLY